MIRQLLLGLFFTSPLIAYEGYLPTDLPQQPWLTGPLVSASGNITKVGTWNVQSYFSAIARPSFYTNEWSTKSEETLWKLQFRTPIWYGVCSWMDAKIVPVWNWNYRHGQAQWTWGDFVAQVNFQLHRDQLPHRHWLPSIKLSIRETLPTGKYQSLNPQKKGTDSGGRGSWVTAFALNMSKMFYFYDHHFFNVCLNFIYAIPTSVHVKGFNAYGGGRGCNGTVRPEKIFQINLGFEYSLSQNWALAFDMVGAWSSKIHFSGTPGMIMSQNPNLNPQGVPASNQQLASIQYSLAPAIEYNWSENLGLIVGSLFTVAGKNSSRFISGVIALNYTL